MLRLRMRASKFRRREGVGLVGKEALPRALYHIIGGMFVAAFTSAYKTSPVLDYLLHRVPFSARLCPALQVDFMTLGD